MRRIYVASKVKHAEMWRELRQAGEPIISTWIDEAGEGQTNDYGELAVRCLSEIGTATALVIYCESGELLKGALMEAGVALASGVPVYCVGTCDSISRVFIHHPLWRICESLQDALNAVEGGADPLPRWDATADSTVRQRSEAPGDTESKRTEPK